MEEKTKKPAMKKTEVKVKTENKPAHSSHGIVAVIRIKGEVKVKPKIKNTLERLRLLRKYTCVLINTKKDGAPGMIDKVKYSVAFGEIERDTLVSLLKARAQKLKDEKFNAEEVAEEIIKGKKLEDLGFKPFFRLHPPRKGINSKLQYPRGVLGNNKADINKLIERML